MEETSRTGDEMSYVGRQERQWEHGAGREKWRKTETRRERSRKEEREGGGSRREIERERICHGGTKAGRVEGLKGAGM